MSPLLKRIARYRHPFIVFAGLVFLAFAPLTIDPVFTANARSHALLIAARMLDITPSQDPLSWSSHHEQASLLTLITLQTTRLLLPTHASPLPESSGMPRSTHENVPTSQPKHTLTMPFYSFSSSTERSAEARS